MTKRIIYVVIAACLFFLNVSHIFAQVGYDDTVEKIHYTDNASTDGAGKPYDADKKIGNPNGSFRVYIWGDFNEPYTKLFLANTFPQLKEKYAQDALFIFRYNPFMPGDQTYLANSMAECAAAQGQFWNDLPALLQTNGDPTKVTTLANINQTTFGTCLQDPETKSIIDISLSDAKYYGFNADPVVVIQNTANPQGYSIKVTGSQTIDIFNRAFAEAKDGDPAKKDLQALQTKVDQVQKEVQTKQQTSKNTPQNQSFFSHILSLLGDIQTNLKKMIHQ